MASQDYLFLVILSIVVYFRSALVSTVVGLCCIVFALPLFALWIFFTAERLTWYSVTFFLLAIIFTLSKSKRKKE